MNREPPITTTATITGTPVGRRFPAELLNGKPVAAFPARGATDLARSLGPGDRVTVELTPYDFSKARIVGRA
jgi:translation initiation factor IF-1